MAELPLIKVEEWWGYTRYWVAMKIQEEQFSAKGRLMVEQVVTSTNPEVEWVWAMTRQVIWL